MTSANRADKDAKLSTLWGGRFEQEPAELLKEINASIFFDYQLAFVDIEGSIVHCKMLAKQGIIKESEQEQLVKALQQIKEEWRLSKIEIKADLEDIHTHNEQRLRELIGPLAGRLHTARSRNDQVALDFKMWCRNSIDSTQNEILALERALVSRASAELSTILPGFTHLQAAQPVSLAHHLLAYVEMFERDRSRLTDCLERLNECPLGAGALAGTSYKIDREYTAQELGFARPSRNSLDSVADRDFAVEFLFCLNLTAVHMSRLAEELVLWSSSQFAFIRFTDAYSTGSSIMPQKRNPDAAELVRGKTGRILASLQGLLLMLKSLPLAYSKDLQEDKESCFAALTQTSICLRVCTGMLLDMEVQRDQMRRACDVGFITATDLADWLVQNLDIPFRDAHHRSGQIVKLAEQQSCQLSELKLEQLQEIEPAISADVYSVLSVENSLKTKQSYGGTAPEQVAQQLDYYMKRLGIT